jgi:hypothetical protein
MTAEGEIYSAPIEDQNIRKTGNNLQQYREIKENGTGNCGSSRHGFCPIRTDEG